MTEAEVRPLLPGVLRDAARAQGEIRLLPPGS